MSRVLLNNTTISFNFNISVELLKIFYPLCDDVISIIIGLLNYFDFKRLISTKRGLNTNRNWGLYLKSMSDNIYVTKFMCVSNLQSLCIIYSLKSHHSDFYSKLSSHYFNSVVLESSEQNCRDRGSDILSGRTINTDFIYYLMINEYIDPIMKEEYDSNQLKEILKNFCCSFRSDIRANHLELELKHPLSHVCNLMETFGMEITLKQKYFKVSEYSDIVIKRLIENIKYIDPVYILTSCIDYEHCELISHRILKILKCISEFIDIVIDDVPDILERVIDEFRYDNFNTLSIHRYYYSDDKMFRDYVDYPDEGFNLHYVNGSINRIAAYRSFYNLTSGEFFYNSVFYDEIDTKELYI